MDYVHQSTETWFSGTGGRLAVFDLSWLRRCGPKDWAGKILDLQAGEPKESEI